MVKLKKNRSSYFLYKGSLPDMSDRNITMLRQTEKEKHNKQTKDTFDSRREETKKKKKKGYYTYFSLEGWIK